MGPRATRPAATHGVALVVRISQRDAASSTIPELVDVVEMLGQLKAEKIQANDLERELNVWIGQYVADQDVITPAVRGRRPLRKAQITVTDVAGNAGWYKVDMKVRPHFKYMGAFFTLGLVGKLDKE